MPRLTRLSRKSIVWFALTAGLVWGLVTLHSVTQLGKQIRGADHHDGRIKHLLQSLQRRTLDTKTQKPEVGVTRFGRKAVLHSVSVSVGVPSANKEKGRSLATPDNHLSDEERLRVEGYEKHAFNELISERIGLHRDVPDTRHKL